MTWTAPKDWEPGPLSAADMNEQVRDNLTALANRLQGHVRNFGGTTLAPGDEMHLAISFDTPYATPPTVVASLASAPGGSVFLDPRAINVTTTGFNLYVYNAGTTDATFSGLSVAWIAVGALA